MSIKENLSLIRSNIEKNSICDNVKLVAITKTVSTNEIKEVINNKVGVVGENRIQASIEKFNDLKDFFAKNNTEFHLVGHLQSNKTKKAVQMFDLIQTVDSLKLARKIDKKAKEIGKKQRILVEVNIGEEEQKYGIKYKEAKEFIKSISEFQNLSIEGLMCMAPNFKNPEDSRPYFRKMKILFDEIKEMKIPNVRMDILSMGMTNDYKVALSEGSNMIRIGRGIFR